MADTKINKKNRELLFCSLQKFISIYKNLK